MRPPKVNESQAYTWDNLKPHWASLGWLKVETWSSKEKKKYAHAYPKQVHVEKCGNVNVLSWRNLWYMCISFSHWKVPFVMENFPFHLQSYKFIYKLIKVVIRKWKELGHHTDVNSPHMHMCMKTASQWGWQNLEVRMTMFLKTNIQIFPKT